MSVESFDQAAVEAILQNINDPETGRSLVKMEQVHNLAVSAGQVHVTIGLTSYSAPVWQDFKESTQLIIQSKLPGKPQVQVEIASHVRPAEPIGGIGLTAKSVIAVGSGKGGVGKSTVAASIACGLKRSGCKVGLMDADVYGPSIPHLLGLDGRPTAENNRLQPIQADGMPVMSMGFLVPADEAVVWRGPMLHGAVTQFLRDTDWGDLDYLIIDMPPGTGDIALTLSQLLPLAGAIVVCTPQDVALIDAVKAVAMFRKVNIPLLGVVENMSYFLCPDTGKQYDIFGSGGAREKAESLEIPFLGEVPIQIDIRQRGDDGKTAENFLDPAAAPFFERICFQLIKNITSNRQANPPLPSLSVL